MEREHEPVQIPLSEELPSTGSIKATESDATRLASTAARPPVLASHRHQWRLKAAWSAINPTMKPCNPVQACYIDRRWSATAIQALP
jgi:hypothetical protein